MGMPGMTTEAVAAYAATANEKQDVAAKKPANTITVAEFRNFVNPTTKYYDNYLLNDFINDDSISTEKKIEVMFGKGIVDSFYGIDMLVNMMKMLIEKMGSLTMNGGK